MKRFTETQKWEDPWFRRLPLEMKLLWQWLCDRCDNAGIIDPDIELASFQIGYQYPMDTLSQFDGRVVKIECGKWFIPKFIEFQYGNLSHDCKAHRPIFLSLEKHGMKGYPKGIDTLQEKEKEKETETETDKEKTLARKKKSNPDNQRVEVNTPTMIRINSWFDRRPDTLWTMTECRALEEINPSEAELEGMEAFYTAPENPNDPLFRRTNVITMLNNWRKTELDKARGYARKQRTTQ
jgi:hypothetical protein